MYSNYVSRPPITPFREKSKGQEKRTSTLFEDDNAPRLTAYKPSTAPEFSCDFGQCFALTSYWDIPASFFHLFPSSIISPAIWHQFALLEFRLEEEMKFCKAYQNHMNGQPNKVPKIGYKRLKHTLKQCRTHIRAQPENKPECTGKGDNSD